MAAAATGQRSRRQRVLARLGRVVAWSAGALALVAVGLALTLWTETGRRALLRVGLAVANARMAGHLSVRGLDGGGWQRLVLIDVRLDDAEGIEAFYARRVELAVDWGALRRRHIHVRDLRVDGGRLTLRHLGDNRLNITALGGPEPPKDESQKDDAKKKEGRAPLTFAIDQLRLQLDGAYHPPRGHEGHLIEWPRGHFDVDGAMAFDGKLFRVRVDRLLSDARDPLQAHVELRGGLVVTPHALPGDRAELTFEDVAVTVTSDGDELARLVPGRLHPRGHWALRAAGGGPLSNLEARAVLSAPTGSLTIDGWLARTLPGLRWHAQVSGAGLDLGAAWRGLLATKLDFALAGQGAGAEGELDVERLRLDAEGLKLTAAGHSDFHGRGSGRLQLAFDAGPPSDPAAHEDSGGAAAATRGAVAAAGGVATTARGVLLARLQALGVPLQELAGALTLDATLARDARGPRIDGRLRGRALAMRTGRLRGGAADLAVRFGVAPNLAIHAVVEGRDLWAGAADVAARARPFTFHLPGLTTTVRGHVLHSVSETTATMANGMRAEATAVTRLGRSGVDMRIGAARFIKGERSWNLPTPIVAHVGGTPVAPDFDIRVAGAHLAGRVHFGHEVLSGDLHLDAPDLAPLGRVGGVALAGAAQLRAAVRWGTELRLDVDAGADGLRAPGVQATRLRAHLASLDLHGDARIAADELVLGSFRLTRLAVDARGGSDRLALAIDGERDGSDGRTHVGARVDGRWQTRGFTVASSDLWVRALTVDLPRQSWRLVAPARVRSQGDWLAIAGLRVRSGLAELALDGHGDPRALDVTLALRDGDLRALGRALGRPELLPAARWNGRIHLAGTPKAPLVEARLDARADHTVAWYGLAFNALSLQAYADSRRFMLHFDAHGQRESRVVLDVHGEPRRAEDGHFDGAAATVERLQVSVHGHLWQLREPCYLELGARLGVTGCRLGSGKKAEVALRGTMPLSRSASPSLDLTLTTQHLDLRDVGDLLAPGHKLPPKTDFDISAHVGGTRAEPILDVALSGRGSQVDEGIPENVDYRVRAHYQDRRVRGDVSMRQVGIRLGVGARFDLPIGLDPERDEPIALELEARPVPFFKIRDALPPAIANLQGFFTLRLSAKGSTHHPELTGELHAPSWRLDDSRDNDTVVNFAYDGAWLRVNSVTSFHATSLIASILRISPKRNSGTVKMELRAPLDLSQLVLSRGGLHALVHNLPVMASAELRAVDLAEVPLQTVGLDAPLTSGRLDGAVRLGGTLHHPELNAELHAHGLAAAGVADHVDVDASLRWERGRVEVAGKTRLRGGPLASFGGHGELDGGALIDGGDWRKGALAIDFELPELGLGRLRNLQPRLHAIDGRLRAEGKLRGSWAAPELTFSAEARRFMLAGCDLGDVRLRGRYQQRRWSFGLDARDGRGRLTATGEVPRDREQPLELRVESERLDVGFLAALWGPIDSVGGTLDMHARIGGTRAAPRPSGWLRLHDGRFALRHDARRYAGSVALEVDGGEAHLTAFELRDSVGGKLSASGWARLDGVVATQLSVTAHAEHLDLGYGSAAARLDGDFAIEGDRTRDVFRGRLDVKKGFVVLPDLPASDAQAPFGALADVRYDDSRAKSEEQRRQAGAGAFVAAHIDGPLSLRSKEANVDLSGALEVTLAGGVLGIAGVVEAAEGGRMKLLGHEYAVERALLAFGGVAADPELHVRATRKIGGTTIAVVIEGTARKPEVKLSCDPPIYDQAQLVSLILAGRTGEDRIALRALDHQIAGVLSGLVIQKIEEQLAPQLPIDVVRPLDQQSYAEFSQSPIEVGRFVTDRIYVGYAHRSGPPMGRSAANAAEARAELRLGGGWELDTTFGDAGVGGIYLFWTKKN